MVNKIKSILSEIGTKIIIKKRILFLLLVLIGIIFGILGMRRIKIDTSNDEIYGEETEIIQIKKKFNRIFGNEEFIFILIESDEIINYETLNYIDGLSRDLDENLPFVKRIVTLTDIEYINVIDGDLYVDNLVGENIPKDKIILNDIKKKILSKEVYLDRIITGDTKKTGIIIEFEQLPDKVYVSKKSLNLSKSKKADSHILSNSIYLEDQIENKTDYIEYNDPKKLIVPAFNFIIDQHKNENIKVVSTGTPIVDHELMQIIPKEMGRSFLITILISILLLLFFYRNLQSVIGPVITMLSTTIICLGIAGWFNLTLSLVAIVSVPLLVVIAISYSIHFINHFRFYFNKTGSRIEAIGYAYSNSIWPCFLTAFTTAFGFISFIAILLKPVRNLGLICGAGTMITYILVMIIVPVFLSMGKDKEIIEQNIKTKDKTRSISFISKLADLSANSYKATIIITLLIVLVMGFFTTRIKIDTDFVRIVGDGAKFVRAAKEIAAGKLGSIYSYEIMLELPEEGMGKDPSVLKSLESLESEVKKFDETKLVTSVINIVKDINMTMNENQREYFKVPDTRELIAQYILLYEMSGGDELEKWVDYNYKYLRMSVQAKRYSTTLRNNFKDIKNFAEDQFPEGAKVYITGYTALEIESIGSLVEGQVKSILLAFLGIAVMMIIVFGSIRTGLLFMIPNVIPIIIATGIMGIFKFPIDAHTVIAAPLLIGVVVDDTIHFFVHFKEELSKGISYLDANKMVFKKIGWALINTSIILSLGFSTFMFTKVDSVNKYGVILIAGIISALLSDLFLSPILLILLKPFRKKKRDK